MAVMIDRGVSSPIDRSRSSSVRVVSDFFFAAMIPLKFGNRASGSASVIEITAGSGAETGWLPAVTAVHHAVYLVSLAVILGFLAWPRVLPLPLRVLAAMVLAGILVNALVCGGISQPSDRYGSRVIWLLPFTAVLAGGVALRREP